MAKLRHDGARRLFSPLIALECSIRVLNLSNILWKEWTTKHRTHNREGSVGIVPVEELKEEFLCPGGWL